MTDNNEKGGDSRWSDAAGILGILYPRCSKCQVLQHEGINEYKIFNQFIGEIKCRVVTSLSITNILCLVAVVSDDKKNGWFPPTEDKGRTFVESRLSWTDC